MTTLFTELDLIRHLYGETSENEKTEIETKVICDADFGEIFSNLKLDASVLDHLSLNPSDFSLEKIFNFSLNYGSNQG